MPNWKKVIVSGSDASLNSLNVTVGVTGSLLGSASYALTASYVPGTFNASASFSNSATWTFTHNLGSQYVVVQTYDASFRQTIPQEITLTDANTATITFPTNETGYAIASKGGVGLSATTASYALTASYVTLAQTASYVTTAQTASYVLNAISASYASTASFYGGSVTSASFASTASYVNSLANQTLVIGSVHEIITLAESTTSPSLSFDFNAGSVFYLRNQTSSTTYNVLNVPTTSQRALALTFVLDQGVTAYSASAYQFNGSAVTVKWLNGTTAPTGSASKVDVVGLTAFRSGSTWNVLGSLSTFA